MTTDESIENPPMIADNEIAVANTLATQCPKCCGTGNIIYLGAPSIVCIDCGGSGRVQTRSVTTAFRAAAPELRPGLMAAAEWHESRLPFWDELIEKYRATGNLVAERGACAYRNSHSSSASILRGKAAGEIGL